MSDLSSNHPYNNQSLSSESSSFETCGICLGNFSLSGKTDVAFLGCSHVFHFSCIGKWTNISSTCPFCKSRFVKFIRTTLKAARSATMTGVQPRGKEVEVSEKEYRHVHDISEFVIDDEAVACNSQCLLRSFYGGPVDADDFCIQCDACASWSHGVCMGFRSEADVPIDWSCHLCTGTSASVEKMLMAAGVPQEIASKGIEAANRWAYMTSMPIEETMEPTTQQPHQFISNLSQSPERILPSSNDFMVFEISDNEDNNQGGLTPQMCLMNYSPSTEKTAYTKQSQIEPPLILSTTAITASSLSLTSSSVSASTERILSIAPSRQTTSNTKRRRNNNPGAVSSSATHFAPSRQLPQGSFFSRPDFRPDGVHPKLRALQLQDRSTFSDTGLADSPSAPLLSQIKTTPEYAADHSGKEFCEVCGNGDSFDDNAILLCDGCDIAVHQHCYGINSIPDGEWLCRPCLRGFRPSKDSLSENNRLNRNLSKPPCIFCPCRGGALTHTTDGRWAHGLCTLWIPEASYMDNDSLEPVGSVNQKGVKGSISLIPRKRFEIRCVLCTSKRGAIVQCEGTGCTAAFHPMCAAVCGLYMNIETPHTLLANRGRAMNMVCLCPRHTSLHSWARRNFVARCLLKLHEDVDSEPSTSSSGTDPVTEDDIGSTTLAFSACAAILTASHSEPTVKSSAAKAGVQLKILFPLGLPSSLPPSAPEDIVLLNSSLPLESAHDLASKRGLSVPVWVPATLLTGVHLPPPQPSETSEAITPLSCVLFKPLGITQWLPLYTKEGDFNPAFVRIVPDKLRSSVKRPHNLADEDNENVDSRKLTETTRVARESRAAAFTARLQLREDEIVAELLEKTAREAAEASEREKRKKDRLLSPAWVCSQCFQDNAGARIVCECCSVSKVSPVQQQFCLSASIFPLFHVPLNTLVVIAPKRVRTTQIPTPILAVTKAAGEASEKIGTLSSLRPESSDENAAIKSGSEEADDDEGYNSEELMRTAPISNKKKIERISTKKEPRYVEEKSAVVPETLVRTAPLIPLPHPSNTKYLDELFSLGISAHLRADTSSYLFFSLTVSHNELLTHPSGTKRQKKEMSEAETRIERCRVLCSKMENSIHQVSVNRIADAIRSRAAANTTEANLAALKAKNLPIAISMYTSSVSRLASVLRAHGTRELASAVISGRIDAPSFIRTLFQRMAAIPDSRVDNQTTISSSGTSVRHSTDTHIDSLAPSELSQKDVQSIRASKLMALREAFARKKALKLSRKEEAIASAAAFKVARAAHPLSVKRLNVDRYDSISAFPTRNLPSRSTRGKHSMSEAAIQERLNQEAINRREYELDQKDPSRVYKRAVAGLDINRIAAWNPELSLSKKDLENVFGSSNSNIDGDLPPGTVSDHEFPQHDQPLDFELIDSDENDDLDRLDLNDEGDEQSEDADMEDLDDAGLEKLLTLVEDSKHDSSSKDKLQKIGLDFDWLALSMASQDSQTFQASDNAILDDVPGTRQESLGEDVDNLLDTSDDLDKLFQQDLLSGYS